MESGQGKLRGMIGRVFPTLASLPRALRGFCWHFSTSDMATNAGSEEISSVENEVEKKEQASESPKKKGAGKRGRAKTGEGEVEAAEAPAKKPRRSKKSSAEGTDGAAMSIAAAPNSSKVTDWSSISWSDLGQTSDGRAWNIKFSSWNVNGVRAWLKNGGFEYLTHEAPDIFCVQETKCAEAALPKDQLKVEGYHTYWNSASKPGYSGTGLYTKRRPLNVTYGMGIEKHDTEGRLITCEFDTFFLVTAYVPNAGEGLKRLDYRQDWDSDFREYLKKLDSQKPLILCGDLNVAHNEIDLKNPKTNTKTAGFTQQERDGFTELLGAGFVDSFRHLHPSTQAFTYWSYRFNARAKNIGWRLDYFVLSERLMKDVCSCVVRSEVVGSDHCPLVLSMAMS